MICVGDKIKRKVKIWDASAGPDPILADVDAEVVYIHPERRYYVIRCDMPGGRSFREALYFFPRCGMFKN